MNCNDLLFDAGLENTGSPANARRHAKGKSINGANVKGRKKTVAATENHTVTVEQAVKIQPEIAIDCKGKVVKKGKIKQGLPKEPLLKATKGCKPGECLKYIRIELHPALANAWYMADLKKEAEAIGCSVSLVSSMSDPALVMWSRPVQCSIALNGEQLGLTAARESCSRGVYVCTAERAAQAVSAGGFRRLVRGVSDLAGCPLTVVVFGVRDYFKPPGRHGNKSKPKLIKEEELEEAIADLLVTEDSDVMLVDTHNQLTQLIIQFTKSIADEPNRRAKRAVEEETEFYMRGVNKNCVPVDVNGNGISNLWQQMLAVLPHSSLETARAVRKLYKSPQQLYQALQDLDTVNNIASIGVVRDGAVDAKERKIGKKFATKLRTVFTCEDGDFVID